MVDYETAKMLAIEYVQLTYGDSSLVLSENETLTKPFGWIFFYNSKEYLETGNLSLALAGNAPLMVDKDTGQVYPTGTAHPLDYYIDQYLRFVK